MNKKFEYVDDNPGSYFGMLVESVEDKEDKKNFRNWIEKRVGKQMSSMKPTKIGYKHGRPYYSVDFIDGTSDDYFIDFDKKEIEKCESLKEDKDEFLKESVSKSDLYSALEYMYGFNKKEANDWIKKASDKMKQSVVDGWKGNAKKSALTDSLKEDKFVSRDKMSKKAQKELNDKKRGTWGNTNPVTRVQPNKKAYDRKRDKKADLDESKRLNESSDGWDESKLSGLSEILDEIYNLQYEVQNTIRGAYTNAHTYEELGYYVHNLGSNLMDVGDEIMEMEEEDEEDED